MGFKGIMFSLLAGASVSVAFTLDNGVKVGRTGRTFPTMARPAAPPLAMSRRFGQFLRQCGEMRSVGEPSDARLVADPEKTR